MNQGRYVGRIRGKQERRQEEYIEYDYSSFEEIPQAGAYRAPEYDQYEYSDANPQPSEWHDFNRVVLVDVMPSDRHDNVRMFIQDVPDYEEEQEPEYVYSRNDRR